jgi:D-arabinose 5-phosphate isomerase GutQ
VWPWPPRRGGSRGEPARTSGPTSGAPTAWTRSSPPSRAATSRRSPIPRGSWTAPRVAATAAARRVDVFGVGASAVVALDLQQKLHRIGLIAYQWSDTHAALTAAALLDERDVAIGISHTGATRDTVEVLDEAASRGALTIGVTSVPRSPLAEVADLLLVTSARETTFRSGATASRIAALSVVDVLFVAVAQSRFDGAVAALDATRQAVAIRRFPQSRSDEGPLSEEEAPR